MANAVPRLAPGGGVTGVISVCPPRPASPWLALTLEFEPAELEPVDPISVRRTRAAAAGAAGTTETAKPDPVVFPATTACSLIGPVAVVKAPTPLPGTSTLAVTGTFAVTCRAAAERARRWRGGARSRRAVRPRGRPGQDVTQGACSRRLGNLIAMQPSSYT